MMGMHLEARGSRWIESDRPTSGAQKQQITTISVVELTTSLEFKLLMLLQWQWAVVIQTKEHLAGLSTDNLTLQNTDSRETDEGSTMKRLALNVDACGSTT
jgi:hypothetical protein